MNVLLTGGSGFIGRELGKELVRRGHEVTIVSRSDEARTKMTVPYPCRVIQTDLTREKIPSEKLEGVDAVIHLLGEGIADHRWSKKQKEKLVQSRLLSSANLLASLDPERTKHVVSATAIGVYGDRGDEILNEDSEPGSPGFLVDLCLEWEKPFREQSKFRWAGIRIGVVLSPSGGALGKLIPLFQKHLGAPVGSGKQWMSWIDLRDLVNLFCFALEKPEVSAVINGVAPEPVTNHDFSKSLADALVVNLLPAVPAPVLKVAYGEMSTVILSSQRVQSRAQKLGFQFQFPRLEDSFQKVREVYRNPGETVFEAEQFFNLPREKVFDFFGDAYNLERITPPLLAFQIQKISTEKIRQGTLIDYHLKIHQVPVHWQTLIEKWNPPVDFIDTQGKGPYALWRHHHTFEELGSGTLVRDVVRYRLPLGFLGKIAGRAFVTKDVQKIFSYRREAIAKLL